jgi:hypothetical protein
MIRIFPDFLQVRAIALVFVICACLPVLATALVATGSIVGTVVDASGQIVPGAQVTVRHVDRNTSTSLIPGVYDGHNRTFFFADYAGIKERRGVTTVNTVPTAAARAGDFSNYRDRNGNLILIYDPLTTRLDADGRIVRDPFPGNVIPQNRMHEVGRNIASIYPLPNNGSGNFDNYISTPDREITDHAFSGRVDHRFSDRDSVFFRFNYGRFRLDAPQGQANCCLPTPAEAAGRFDLGPFIAGIQNTKLTTHGAAFNYSRVIRSRTRWSGSKDVIR